MAEVESQTPVLRECIVSSTSYESDNVSDCTKGSNSSVFSIKTLLDRRFLKFMVGAVTILFALVESAVSGSIFLSVLSDDLVFFGSDYIFGAWWSMIVALIAGIFSILGAFRDRLSPVLKRKLKSGTLNIAIIASCYAILGAVIDGVGAHHYKSLSACVSVSTTPVYYGDTSKYSVLTQCVAKSYGSYSYRSPRLCQCTTNTGTDCTQYLLVPKSLNIADEDAGSDCGKLLTVYAPRMFASSILCATVAFILITFAIFEFKLTKSEMEKERKEANHLEGISPESLHRGESSIEDFGSPPLLLEGMDSASLNSGPSTFSFRDDPEASEIALVVTPVTEGISQDSQAKQEPNKPDNQLYSKFRLFATSLFRSRKSEKKSESDKTNSQILEGISPRSLHESIDGISPFSVHARYTDESKDDNPEGISPLSLLRATMKQNDEAEDSIESMILRISTPEKSSTLSLQRDYSDSIV